MSEDNVEEDGRVGRSAATVKDGVLKTIFGGSLSARPRPLIMTVKGTSKRTLERTVECVPTFVPTLPTNLSARA